METAILPRMVPDAKGKTFRQQAEDFIGRLPGTVNHGNLLCNLVVQYLMDFKYGNKREERAACDFLNLVQEEADKLAFTATEAQRRRGRKV